MSSEQFAFTWGTPTLHQSGLREHWVGATQPDPRWVSEDHVISLDFPPPMGSNRVPSPLRLW